MKEIVDRLIKLAKNYRAENQSLGDEFLYKGNKKELDNWMNKKKELEIKEETCFEILENLEEEKFEN